MNTAKASPIDGKPVSEAIKVLIADDNPLDAELQIRSMRESGMAIESRLASTEQSFVETLRSFAPDVVLCDFSFPDFDGPEALRILRRESPLTPFIFVSGTLSEERAVLAVQNGAADYVLKSNLVRLPGAVARAIERAQEHKARLEAERRVHQLSRTKDVLSSVNSAIVRLRDRDELFREACRIATENGGFAYSFIVMIDGKHARVSVPALLGVQTQTMDKMVAFLQGQLDDLDNAPGVFAQSLRTRQPAAVNALTEHPEIPIAPLLLGRGINAVASVPILLDGEPAGAMVFAAREAGFFSSDEIHLLTDLTNNLAFAIDLIEKQARVDYLSYYDPLTELPNRSLFFEKLGQALALARPTRSMTALVLLDVRQFTQLNASLGQRAADDILRQAAKRLCARFGSEQVARWSGDRFAVSFPAIQDLQHVMDVLAEEGLQIFHEPFKSQGRDVTVSVRAGCTIAPQDGDDAETLARNAEIALENARSSGTAYQFYSKSLGKQLEARVDLESRLRLAADRGEFVLYYQPKVDVATREVKGIEALIRWRDPSRHNSLIAPGEFVSVLEQSGLIVSVGKWVLHEAARQYAAWRKTMPAAPRIAVNLSARQLMHANIVNHVRRAVEVCDGSCGLDLEITETMLMENLGEAAKKLRDIRALGVEIALDDFGTGYSSLAALHQLPISLIKIDRSFVNGMTDDPSKSSMIATVISLAQSLRLKVVAEGVETEEQARLLHLLQCDQMQGYLVARPGPAEAVEEFFALK